jgi:hypothetical protein
MYIGDLIKLIRQQTDNQDWAKNTTTGYPTEGITDDLVLAWCNDAQDYLQGKILNTFPDEFVVSNTQSLVANTEEYSISDNLYIGRKFVSVRLSRTGYARDFYSIRQKTLLERDTRNGHPLFYIPRSGKLLLNPIYQGGSTTMEVNYYRELDNLCTRRGLISSKTSTSITLAASSASLTRDDEALGGAEYICISDRFGVVKDYNVISSSYNSGTGVITIPSQTLTGVAGDYVTVGRYTTTHSKLNEHCERYIRVYASKRMLGKDSSVDIVTEDDELRGIEAEIIESYSNITEDPVDVPIIDDLLE